MVASSLCTIWLGLSLAPAVVSTPPAPHHDRDAASCAPTHGASAAFLHQPAACEMNGRRFAARDEARSADAARFGADRSTPATIVVEVAGLFPFEAAPRRFEIDPFTPVRVDRGDNHWSDPYSRAHEQLAAKVEAARQAWLKDRNFTGGVRTFTNAKPEAAAEPAKTTEHAAASARIEPRAVMELPADLPRVRSKLRVLAPGESPVRAKAAATRVVDATRPGEQTTPKTPHAAEAEQVASIQATASARSGS